MQQVCTACTAPFKIASEDLEFYDKVSPMFGGKKYAVPAPTHCPKCRQQRRLAWRNERTLYNRSCDLCKKKIVSVYPDKTEFPVYCVTCWWGGTWDPKSFAIDYDPTRSFLEQYRELHARVPKLAIQNDNGITSENSEYCYDVSRAKNCYLLIGSWYDENCMYGLNIGHSKDIVDCNTVILNSELVYESVDSQHIYHSAYLQNCENCSDCFFGYDLKGCRNCFGCFGLRQKQYCFFNEQLEKEDYEKRMQECNLGSHQFVSEMRKKFDAWILQFPRKFANLQNCEDCSGNNLFNCKSVHSSYSVYNSEYSKFIDRSDGPKSCYDIINSGGPEWCYDCVVPDDSYMVLFSVWCWKSKYIVFSDNCHSSEQLLGCVSMHRGKYCILNKQYEKDEYERLAGLAIESLQKEGAWGEHPSVTLSPFAYNESTALEYYPLIKEDVLKRGWKWTEALPHTTRKETVYPADLPDDIHDVSDTVSEEILACEQCKKNFKVTHAEVSFYRRMPCPIPRHCFDCRHLERFHRKTPTELFDGSCAKCGVAFQTTYAPGRLEIIYCEQCYLQTVY